MAKTPIDKLNTAVSKILAEYEGNITKNVAEVTKEIGKKGAQAVKASAMGAVKGKRYASGWTYEAKQTRLSTSVVIYNKSLPGLAHLLEKGHAKVGGGRVDGRPHIAPVEEELIKDYEEGVRNAIDTA